MEKIWKIKESTPEKRDALSAALGADHVVAQLLINRDILDVDDARRFLDAKLLGLHDPFLLKGMREAIDRVKQAQLKQERVLIFGDYDVDGVTASAVLFIVLSGFGIDVVNHIPHRMDDGYGLNQDIVPFLKKEKISLVITVDCGVTALDEVAAMKAQGIDVIVIDHHEPSEGRLPDALAVIDPKQESCSYPFRYLAGVGLAFKFGQALLGRIDEDLLDLAALGTVADVVPLVDENRILVKHGLGKVNRTKNPGLRALLELTKIKDKKITPFHVGFILGPRINAAGRMDSAHTSLDLFLCKNMVEAYDIARELEGHNLERQKLQKNILVEALELVEEQVSVKDDNVIVLCQEGWHKGVLGIVASKVSEKYYRPTIVISVKDGVGTASGRSVDGFHLFNAIHHCHDLLDHYGGHEGAVGLTIDQNNIDPFRKLINEFSLDGIKQKKMTPTLHLDCEIELSDINVALADTLEQLQPFGEGNPQPLFCVKKVRVAGAPRMLARETIKFWATDGDVNISAVGFGMAKYREMLRPNTDIDLAFQITIDDWNKAPTPQLILKDIKVSQE